MTLDYATPRTVISEVRTTLQRRTMRILSISLVLLAMIFVWPTAFRYESTGTALVRINRFTGRAEMLSVSGWHELKPAAQPWDADPVIGTAQPKP